jgi:hypothetical protein
MWRLRAHAPHRHARMAMRNIAAPGLPVRHSGTGSRCNY